ncbi:MAG: class I SAM-dependent methyltransferase [Actinomycetota bacterium]|nr:class I SAM-dependent methyltransferase [Actinomycetota bacterium]
MSASESAEPAAAAAAASRLEPGSFRDWDSRVFYDDGRVLRVLSDEGLRDWLALAESSLFADAVVEGKVVGTSRLSSAAAPETLVGRAAAVLEHERLPFVSYPYEWPFSMLRDAAVLQLELLRRAVAEGLMMKDASSYNVQWRGATPVFVDVGSFTRLAEGEPWQGYRQFCMLFLNPLLLQAYKGIPFQPWLRGKLAGISPGEARSVMSSRDLLRRGVLTHVALHARLERRHGETDRDVKRELRAAGFRTDLIVANVRRLERLVRGLEWRPHVSEWSEYGATTSYTAADAARKEAFVREIVHSRRWSLVWDIGCNDGRHARIAAENAQYVIGLDADAAIAEGLYRSLRAERAARILPLVVDVTDPSPALGWAGRERQTLAERGTPDLTLCLAVLHHVALAGNVPVPSFLSWLHGLETALVIEFATREDPRVARLLARKRPGAHPDYDRGPFERALAERFHVERSEALGGRTRVLYFARPK